MARRRNDDDLFDQVYRDDDSDLFDLTPPAPREKAQPAASPARRAEPALPAVTISHSRLTSPKA